MTLLEVNLCMLDGRHLQALLAPVPAARKDFGVTGIAGHEPTPWVLHLGISYTT